MRIALMGRRAGRRKRRPARRLSAFCADLQKFGFPNFCRSAFDGIQQYQGAKILILQIFANIYLVEMQNIKDLQSKKLRNFCF